MVPAAIQNDGLIDVCCDKYRGKLGSLTSFDAVKAGGLQVIHKDCHYFRGKKIKMTAKSKESNLMALDGENFPFDKYCMFECMPNEIELLMDPESLFKSCRNN